jgi:hypothetical protein
MNTTVFPGAGLLVRGGKFKVVGRFSAFVTA